jgi:hypothetical protein
MNRINEEIKKEILLFNSRGGISIIIRYVLRQVDGCIKWIDFLSIINNDTSLLQCFKTTGEDIGITVTNDGFQLRAMYKIFFMIFHEALPVDIQNNEYLRVKDVIEKFGNLKIKAVDFDSPVISAKISNWLNEIQI